MGATDAASGATSADSVDRAKASPPRRVVGARPGGVVISLGFETAWYRQLMAAEGALLQDAVVSVKPFLPAPPKLCVAILAQAILHSDFRFSS